MDPTPQEARLKAAFFPKLARVLARAPFAADLLAAYYCAFDPATPLRAKGILLGAIAYFILPADAVPDIVMGLGFTDDLAVLLAAVNAVRSHLTPVHHARARGALARLRAGGTAFA